MARSHSKEHAAFRDAARSAFSRQRDALETASRILAGLTQIAGRKVVQKSRPTPSKAGVGVFIAAGFGVALVAGAAYVAWQVLRTDDKAWIDDEFDVD
jgi:hypothetical protein